MQLFKMYTDGGFCNTQSKGIGSWAYILLKYDEKKKEYVELTKDSGREFDTTNNKMELTACIEALNLLKEPCKVQLFSDSAYVVNAFNQDWISSWQANGWKNSQKKDVANIDLWKKLIKLNNYHQITFNKVKGHAGDKYNEICDALATGRKIPNQ